MTAADRKATLQTVEKAFYSSKKWLAWFIQQILMATMAIIALIKQPQLGWPLATFMGGIVFMMGVSTMWYLGKQAAADIAVRGFAMIGEVPKKLKEEYANLKGDSNEEPTS